MMSQQGILLHGARLCVVEMTAAEVAANFPPPLQQLEENWEKEDKLGECQTFKPAPDKPSVYEQNKATLLKYWWVTDGNHRSVRTPLLPHAQRGRGQGLAERRGTAADRPCAGALLCSALLWLCTARRP
jgi:hypothetical protein